MQELPIIIKNRAGMARWGFRPSWAKTDEPAMAAKMINARSETIAEKPAFRESWARARRCIIPANGFFEWKKDEGTGKKQPYFIHAPDNAILNLAGLWSKTDDQITFTILTKPADGDIQNLHHRMPVMLPTDQIPDWFSGKDATTLITNATGKNLNFHTVSNDVRKVSNDHANLITHAA